MTEISFTFTPTAANLSWLLSTVYRGILLWVRVAGFTAVAVGLLIVGAGNGLGWIVSAAGVVISLVPSLYVRYTAGKMTGFRVLRDREVTISESGVSVKTPVATGWTDVDLITYIHTDATGWIFLFEGGGVTMIPRQVLSQEQMAFMEAFVDSRKKAWSSANAE